jgi:meiotic recombination protein SPO11
MLIDGDPHGIEILSVYKYGSRSLQHENDTLAAPRLEWLGLWLTELEE